MRGVLRAVLGLSVWFSKPDLTCFRFGPAYLMVERGGFAFAGEKPRDKSPVVLRLNVREIDRACAELRERGVSGATVSPVFVGQNRPFFGS